MPEAGLSLDEIESLFRRPLVVFPDPAHSAGETRFKAIGRTDEGRSVLIVFTLRAQGAGPAYPSDQRSLHACEGD